MPSETRQIVNLGDGLILVLGAGVRYLWELFCFLYLINYFRSLMKIAVIKISQFCDRNYCDANYLMNHQPKTQIIPMKEFPVASVPPYLPQSLIGRGDRATTDCACLNCTNHLEAL